MGAEPAFAPVDPAFTVPMLAERWHCSENSIRTMIRTGQLRSFRIGVLIRVPAAEVVRLECLMNTQSSDSGEASPSSTTTMPESDTAKPSPRPIGLQRKQRHEGAGHLGSVHRGPWGE